MTQEYRPGKFIQECVPVLGKGHFPVSQPAAGRAGTEKETGSQDTVNHKAALGSPRLL